MWHTTWSFIQSTQYIVDQDIKHALNGVVQNFNILTNAQIFRYSIVVMKSNTHGLLKIKMSNLNLY